MNNSNDTQNFLFAQENFLKTKNKKDWDRMFFYVFKACGVQLKKYIEKKRIFLSGEVFYFRQIDATMAIMQRYLKPEGYKIQFIVTVARNSVFDIMTRKKTREQEEIERLSIPYDANIYYEDDLQNLFERYENDIEREF